MIHDMTAFFKALGDPTRQRIINLLLYRPTLHVNEFCEVLQEPQSKISRHLTVLKNAGWLLFSRRDKRIYYRIDAKLDQDFLNAFKKLFQNSIQFETDLKNLQNHY